MKLAGTVSANYSVPALQRARIVSEPQHSSRPKLWFGGSAAAVLLIAGGVLLWRYYGARCHSHAVDAAAYRFLK